MKNSNTSEMKMFIKMRTEWRKEKLDCREQGVAQPWGCSGKTFVAHELMPKSSPPSKR